MKPHALVIGVCCLLASPQASRGDICRGLDDDVARALNYFVTDDAGLRPGSEDKDELRWGRKVIVEHGQAALPCLLEVYRNGPVKAGLWHDGGLPPAEGKWALALIREIDAKVAIELYKSQSQDALDDLGRARANAEAAILGDPSVLDGLVAFLRRPPVVAKESEPDLIYVQERAMMAVSVNNYRAALPAIQELEKTSPHKKLVAVYAAQLSGDVESLQRAVKDDFTAETALFALKRMGKSDIVKRIAEDRTDPANRAAVAVLSGRTGQ